MYKKDYIFKAFIMYQNEQKRSDYRRKKCAFTKGVQKVRKIASLENSSVIFHRFPDVISSFVLRTYFMLLWHHDQNIQS